jgi:hypothetical protein
VRVSTGRTWGGTAAACSLRSCTDRRLEPTSEKNDAAGQGTTVKSFRSAQSTATVFGGARQPASSRGLDHG